MVDGRMKAVIYERYGRPDDLEIREVELPTPESGEVLVRVRAAGVNQADRHLLSGSPLVVRFMAGLLRPKRGMLGLDLAGTVESVAPDVTRFEPGDEVFGVVGERFVGSFAEYAVASEEGLALKPESLGFDEAAASPVAAVTALQGLREGKIEAGKRLLVNGASGGVGTFAVQIARSLGAEVTGVCSTRNLDLVRSLGARHVVDYTEEDFTRPGETYDLILDTVGNRKLSDLRRALDDDGVYVAIAGPAHRLLWLSVAGGERMRTLMARPTSEDMETLRALFEAGEIRTVVDRRYTLEEAPEAIRDLADGHTRGKRLIVVEEG